jgi:hypothetical protein
VRGEAGEETPLRSWVEREFSWGRGQRSGLGFPGLRFGF